MIRVASNVADDIVRRADELDATAMIQAAKTLPGYQTHERAIRSQFSGSDAATQDAPPAHGAHRDVAPSLSEAD